MISERSYWLIRKSSPVMKVIGEALSQQRVFEKAMNAIKVEFDASDLLVWKGWAGTTFSGLVFKGAAPDGWRKSKACFKPDGRRKEGRELIKRFDALPRGIEPPAFSSMLTKAMDIDFTFWGDGGVSWTIYEHHGASYILSVPASLKITAIPGCVELKMSDYWKLREKAA